MRLVVCVLALLTSACAKGEAEQHRNTTQRMLSARGTPDFVDASSVEYAAVRHTPSGMICVLPADGAFAFDVFPAAAMNAGAQCSGTEGEVVTAWVAVQFREPTTLDAAFSSAIAELTGNLSTQAWPGSPSLADRSSPEGLPHYRIHRLEADMNGERRYLRVAMAEQDGWYVQQIVSAPLADAERAEARAGEAWRAGIRPFSAYRRENPLSQREAPSSP